MTMQHQKNFIAGQWVDGKQSITVIEPTTGEAFATIATADNADVERAVREARACIDSGVLIDCRPVERADWMRRIAANIRELIEPGSELLMRENGKLKADAREEFITAARYFDYYAGIADKIEGKSIPLGIDYIDFTYYEPLGISVQIIPWNFPVDICARSLAPALAAGNAVIVKSPENSPLAITLLATACQDAGLPDGALSILSGPGPETGAALVAHPDINQVVFTGSVKTGQTIMHAAVERAVPCIMELGGKSAAVVFPDYDSAQLMSSIKSGIFYNAGQVCSAMSRLLVHKDIYQQVLDETVALANNLKIGDMDDADMMPLISEDQRKQVLAHCDTANQQGARCLAGGSACNNLAGYYVEPTVFADVAPDMSIFRNEVFGPVLAVTPFDNEAEAWALANNTDYGLVAGVFTQDISRALRASRALKAGQIFINEWYAGGIETPFGGLRLSGFGREKGIEALYNYVNTKNIAIRVAKDLGSS